MKLPELKHNLKFATLSLVCVSGLVSCYPIKSTGNEVVAKTPALPVGVKSPEEIKAAKVIRDAQANSNTTTVKKSKERLEREEKARIARKKRDVEAWKKQQAAKKKAAGSSTTKKYTPPKKTTSSSSSSSPSPTKTYTAPKKPVTSSTTKYAASVPGKSGFVYNPYTHNQVDVRGIPSGTKVRDPHDSNPAHVFKVP